MLAGLAVATGTVVAALNCKAVIQYVGHQLGLLAADLCTLLDPHYVIIGGRLSGAGELLSRPIDQAVHDHALQIKAELMSS